MPTREKFLIYGNDYQTKNGTTIRDFVYVVDFAEVNIITIKRLIANKQKQ